MFIQSIRDGRPTTKSEAVFKALQHDIVTCAIRPGTKLLIERLCSEYSVGLSPMREALSRLAERGLVVLHGQRGFSVAPVSRSDLIDSTSARIELEHLNLRKAIELGDNEWEASILAAYHRLSTTPLVDSTQTSSISEKWEHAHNAFHESLVAASDSPWLLNFRRSIVSHMERYRNLSIAYASLPRGAPAAGQKRNSNDVFADDHKALCTAAIERRADEACEIMTKHLQRTRDRVLTAASELFGDQP